MALRTVLKESVALVFSSAKREAFGILATDFVASACGAGQLLVGAVVLERITSEDVGQLGDFLPWLVILAGLMVVSSVSQIVASELSALAQEIVTRDATQRVVAAASSVEYARYDDPDFHDRLTRARAGAAERSWAVVYGVFSVTRVGFQAAAVVAVLAVVVPWVLIVAVAGAGPLLLVSRRNNRVWYELAYDLTSSDRDRDYHTRLLTGPREAKEIRVFGLASLLRDRLDRLFEVRLAKRRAIAGKRVAWASAASAASSLFTVAAIGAIVHLTVRGEVTLAEAAVGVVGVRQLSSNLRALTTGVSMLHDGALFLRDFTEFVEGVPADVPSAAGPVHRGSSRLFVDAVTFTYPGKQQPVLHDVEFTILPGETVALVGPNGSGKSSLVKVICGLYQPDEGAVRWDDDGGKGSAHSRVAPVFQDFVPFELTGAENVAIGDPARLDDHDGVIEAASRAGALDLLGEIDDGDGARLSRSFSGGHDLSIGQWQRLAIARALFRDADLLVMDEPSAALDPKAELDLLDALMHRRDGQSLLFITHRYTSVKSADKIIVLHDGRVVEVGTHVELMQANGLYSNLYTTQSRHYDADGRS